MLALVVDSQFAFLRFTKQGKVNELSAQSLMRVDRECVDTFLQGFLQRLGHGEGVVSRRETAALPNLLAVDINLRVFVIKNDERRCFDRVAVKIKILPQPDVARVPRSADARQRIAKWSQAGQPGTVVGILRGSVGGGRARREAICFCRVAIRRSADEHFPVMFGYHRRLACRRSGFLKRRLPRGDVMQALQIEFWPTVVVEKTIVLLFDISELRVTKAKHVGIIQQCADQPFISGIKFIEVFWAGTVAPASLAVAPDGAAEFADHERHALVRAGRRSLGSVAGRRRQFRTTGKKVFPPFFEIGGNLVVVVVVAHFGLQ